MTNCHGLKMTAADGKKRLTDVADTEQLLRIIHIREGDPSQTTLEPWERFCSAMQEVGRKAT